jgi:hypothetical protein
MNPDISGRLAVVTIPGDPFTFTAGPPPSGPFIEAAFGLDILRTDTQNRKNSDIDKMIFKSRSSVKLVRYADQ